jgi:hypothetical protein
MKKVFVAILLISPVFMAALCDDDLADIALDAWYEKTVTVEETNDNVNPAYESTYSSISLADDPTVSEYQDKIKNLRISEMWLEVHNVTGTGLTANIDLSYVAGGVEIQIGHYTGISIVEGSKIEVIPDADMQDDIAKKLKDGEEVVLKSTVVMSDAPFKLDLNARIHVEGTANPL